MIPQDLLLEVRRHLPALYPSREAIRGLLELAGVDVEGLDLNASAEVAWRRALDECQIQGSDAVESLLVELLEAHPGLREAEMLLKHLARGGPQQPDAAEDGGSLIEAVVRDPLEGVEVLIAFAEARGEDRLVVLQLKRCQEAMLAIARDRRQHGRTLAHESRWKKILHEVLDLAHRLQDDVR